MLKNSKYITLICGCISVAVTIIFYLLTFNSIFTVPIRWISLMFLIFSEILGTFKAVSVKKSIFGVSSISASLIHLGMVLVMSVIFVNLFPFFIKTYVLLNMLLLCALLAIDVTVYYFGNRTDEKNRVFTENQSTTLSLCTAAEELSAEFCNTEYIKDLNEICELLKYSDIGKTHDEGEIFVKFEELKKELSSEDEKAKQTISELKNAIKIRSLKIKNSKRGSI